MTMPQPAIGLLEQDSHDRRLEIILRRLGYQVLTYTRCHLMLSSLPGHGAGMALINRPLTPKERQQVHRFQDEKGGGPSFLLCGRENETADLGCELLPDPFDIPRLHDALQKHLPQSGRKHLRASIKLPALVCDEGENLLGEVRALGTGGLQLESAVKPLRRGQQFEVVLPLLGEKKELEIPCEVLYHFEPDSSNHFHFQAGVRFLECSSSMTDDLEAYLSRHLLTAPDDNGYVYQPIFDPPPAPRLASQKPAGRLAQVH